MTIHAPPIQKTTTPYDVGLAPKRLAELFSRAAEHRREHDDDRQGLDHRHEGAHEEREPTPRPGGGVEHDEHERLDRDAADQVADGEVEVARERR